MNNNMVNPRVDIAFKKLFGVKENKDILMSFLNSIISAEDQVDEIELLNPYNERNFPKDKLSILDIKARNKNTKVYFLIEMQLSDEMNYHQRSLYSWARVYSNQLGSGDNYVELKKTIAIHILNFTFIDYKEHEGWKSEYLSKYHHCFTLQDKVNKIEVFKDLEIHTIELNKFEGSKGEHVEQVLSKIKNALDRWVAVLTRYVLLNAKSLPKEIDFPEIKKALSIMQEMKFNEHERDMYDAHLDFLRMEYSTLSKRFADGIAKGMEEGIAKGELKGKIETARNLLSENMSVDLIAKVTGLTEEEIRGLKK